jgi:SPP1 family predicted phage head-tail adaptor
VGILDKRVTLQDRAIQAPIHGETEFTEDFDSTATVWAAVRTTTGKTLFDGVGVDVAITHEVIIRYAEGVTSETWIELADGTRLDVVKPENLDERGDFLRLLCTDKGSKDKEASGA